MTAIPRPTASLLLAVLLAAGCTELEGDPAVPTGGSDNSLTPAHAAPGHNPPSGHAPAAGTPSNPMPQDAVKLSTGTALPQTLPTGTTILFSVHYELLSRPEGNGRFEWVIERSQGEPYRKSVELQDRGMLEALDTGWPPGQEPYSSHIEWIDEQGTARRVSPSAPMS